MSDGHAAAQAEVDSRRGDLSSGGHTQGFGWRNIILAFALVAALAVTAWSLVVPSVYVGEVRWGSDYSTITLAGSAKTLTVDDRTSIYGRGGAQLSQELLRTSGFDQNPSAFQATVVYKGDRAWSVSER